MTMVLTVGMLAGCGNGAGGNDGSGNAGAGNNGSSAAAQQDATGGKTQEQKKAEPKLNWVQTLQVKYLSGEAGGEVQEEVETERTVSTYNDAGKLLKSEHIVNPEHADELGISNFTREYTYDGENRRLSYRYLRADGTRYEGKDYSYSEDGCTVKVINYSGDDVNGQVTTEYTDVTLKKKKSEKTYNASGEQLKSVWIYNEHGDRSSMISYESDDSKKETTYEYTYDAGGNLVKEVQKNYFQGELSSTTTREYDAQGRKLSSMEMVQGKKGASGEEYTYEGDLVEYKTKKTYDEGELELEYARTFDAAGNITEEIETVYLGYDENGTVLGKGVTRRTYEWKSFEAED